MRLKSYQKDFEFSYCFGAFATFELVKYQPKQVLKVIFHSSFSKDTLVTQLVKNHIPYEVDDQTITRLSPKENHYVMAVFSKYKTSLANDASHVVLVNPSNMGNLGTIIRTMLGFNVRNLAIIRPGVDYFDPKVVRASMGSLFAENIEYFDSIEDYITRFPQHECYPFMLQTDHALHDQRASQKLVSLIFGNESSGLDERYLHLGTPIRIHHSLAIDSLNLTNAVAIALYDFFKNDFE